jgi:hypothetical protein
MTLCVPRRDSRAQEAKTREGLKEQFEYKRLNARKRPALAEAGADFDIRSIRKGLISDRMTEEILDRLTTIPAGKFILPSIAPAARSTREAGA